MPPKGPTSKIDLVAVARHIIDYEPVGQQTFLARGADPGAELPLPWTVAKPLPKPRPTVRTYERYGYWASVNSSIAAWAVIAAD